jgi:molybdopterin converting factor subunit 1
MEVSVRLFATFRQEAGWAEKRIEVPEETTVSGLMAILEAEQGLRLIGRPVYAAVSQEYTTQDRVLQAGDEVALFPPVSGGRGC